MLWTFMVVHLVFINVPICQWIFLNLCYFSIMLSLDPLLLFLQLSLLWNDIYGTFALYLPTCTSVDTTNGVILLIIIFWAHASIPSYFFLTLDHEAPPSSTLFFLLRGFLGDSIVAFFIFSIVIYIFFFILLTLACGFYGFSFWRTNKYLNFFANIKAD
jgi:hypothetical protein